MTSKQQWLDDTLVVIVLFKMALQDSATFVSLTQSLKSDQTHTSLFVYDNSPTAGACLESNVCWKIEYCHDPDNGGVSRAYNEGRLRAQKARKNWLLLVDQDTQFPVASFSLYHQSLVQHSDQTCFVPILVDEKGIVSPFRFRLGNGFRIGSTTAGLHPLEKLQFINSGMLIHIKSFEKAGGFNEKLKLDFSDLSFLTRLKKFSSHFVVVNLTGIHSLSGVTKENIDIAISRFRLYCQAAKELKRSEMEHLSLLFCLVPHALRLCVTYRNLIFVSVAMQTLRTRHAQ